MNKHQSFLANSSQVKRKSQKAQKYITLVSMSTFLAACNGATNSQSTSTTTPTPSSASLVKLDDVTGTPTHFADNITLGAIGNAGTVDAGRGDDVIVGGASVDFIRGGGGADNIKGGAGVDNFVIIGVTSNADYTLDDLVNPNGTGIDLSQLLKLEDVNNNAISDAVAGEVIDGGADGAILFIYGTADLRGVTIKNITRIDMHSEVTFSAEQMQKFIADGTLQDIIGDKTTKLTIKCIEVHNHCRGKCNIRTCCCDRFSRGFLIGISCDQRNVFSAIGFGERIGAGCA